MLDCGATVTEAKGRIVQIETLDPYVTETLCRVIPWGHAATVLGHIVGHSPAQQENEKPDGYS